MMKRFWVATLRFCVVTLVSYFTLSTVILVCPQAAHVVSDSAALATAHKDEGPDWGLNELLNLVENVKRVGIAPILVTSGAILFRLIVIPIIMFVVLCVRFWQFHRRLRPIPKRLYSVQALVLYFAVLCYSRPLFLGSVAVAITFTFVCLAPVFGFLITCLEAAGLWAAVQQQWVQDYVMPVFFGMEVAVGLLLHQHSIDSTGELTPERFGVLLFLKFVCLILEGWGVLFLFWNGCTVGVSYLQEQFSGGQPTASEQTPSRSTKKTSLEDKAAAVEARRLAGLAAARRMIATY